MKAIVTGAGQTGNHIAQVLIMPAFWRGTDQ